MSIVHVHFVGLWLHIVDIVTFSSVFLLLFPQLSLEGLSLLLELLDLLLLLAYEAVKLGLLLSKPVLHVTVFTQLQPRKVRIDPALHSGITFLLPFHSQSHHLLLVFEVLFCFFEQLVYLDQHFLG
jgi:hypothetical protein